MEMWFWMTGVFFCGAMVLIFLPLLKKGRTYRIQGTILLTLSVISAFLAFNSIPKNVLTIHEQPIQKKKETVTVVEKDTYNTGRRVVYEITTNTGEKVELGEDQYSLVKKRDVLVIEKTNNAVTSITRK